MAKKVTVTKVELAALKRFQDLAAINGWEGSYNKALANLIAKIEAPEKTREGVSLPDAELALGGCRKYAPFRGGNRWALEGRLRTLGIHQGELEAVGNWVDRQPWLTEVTMQTLLNNWSNWLSRTAAMYQRDGVTMPVWRVTTDDEGEGEATAAHAQAYAAAPAPDPGPERTDNPNGPTEELDGARE